MAAGVAAAPDGWLPRWRVWHDAAAAGLLGAIVTLAAAAPAAARLSTEAQAVALVAAVAVFGVPHGALDPLVGRQLLAPRLGRWWWPAFHGGYLLLAGAVVAGWAVAPAATLVAFLAASAVHFGLGDVTRARSPRGLGWAEVLARGAAPIAVPALAFPRAVAEAFGWVAAGAAPGEVARVAAGAAGVARWLVLPAAGAFALWHLGAAWRAWQGRFQPEGRAGAAAHAADALECLAVPALAAAVPPLAAFLVYFCLLHSARHAAELAAGFDPERAGRAWARFARAALPATAATLALGAAAWAGLRGGAAPGARATVRVLFAGLAALTGPHMVLAAWAGRADGARA